MFTTRPLHISVNGVQQTLTMSPEISLLHLLRNDLLLNSPKYGCGLGECGACTVLVDGVAARACVIPRSRAFSCIPCGVDTFRGYALPGYFCRGPRRIHEECCSA